MHRQNPLLGVWSGCAFPTQETTLIFCENGKGLMFFYWGSCAESPFVDEFKWELDSPNQVHIEWIQKHEYDLDSEEDKVMINSGEKESIYFEVDDIPALRIELGMHFGFDSALLFSRKVDDFELEKERITEFNKSFDPFGPNRRIWIFSDNQPQKPRKPWWKFF